MRYYEKSMRQREQPKGQTDDALGIEPTPEEIEQTLKRIRRSREMVAELNELFPDERGTQRETSRDHSSDRGPTKRKDEE